MTEGEILRNFFEELDTSTLYDSRATRSKLLTRLGVCPSYATILENQFRRKHTKVLKTILNNSLYLPISIISTGNLSNVHKWQAFERKIY